MSSVIKSQQLTITAPRDLEDKAPERDVIERTPQEQKVDEVDVQAECEQLLTDARASAEQIIVDARQEADCIIDKARNDANEVLQQAQRQGYDQGFDQGLIEGSQAGEQLTKEAAEILEHVQSERDRVFTETREQLAELAIEIAERLIGEQLAAEPEKVADMGGKALSLIRESERCSIRVHPRDVLFIEERRRELKRRAPDVQDVDIVGDESLEPGEIVVDSNRGQVDGTISTRIATARESLLEVVHDDEQTVRTELDSSN